MKILVGSTNPTKVNAVRKCVEKYPYFQGVDVEVIGYKCESGVSDMPLTRDEMFSGARNRAHSLKEQHSADFYVGIEGGTEIIRDVAMLYGIVHILNNTGEEHFAFSPAIEVPNIIQKGLYQDGRELGPLQDEISNVADTKKKLGCHGMWSDEMVTRQEEFESSFFLAISPFYNKFYKG